MKYAAPGATWSNFNDLMFLWQKGDSKDLGTRKVHSPWGTVVQGKREKKRKEDAFKDSGHYW